ncbi:M20 aminoacylase family protein [Amylibacter sp. IMCC11727]|uniref:M20 aminoacylase family protein n=1 Tax=Amylibacter sp. IMCC11727 TaxID=3039851 RepID=UPI00244DC836|nr:M20 aminoacylase family protein [Amylibacter sp. IMCC11727]WGI21287.1 M20 family metallopeptidase [Amylibacter sp. IMCC11727]
MPLINRFAETHAELTAIRRDLHMHPELQFDCHRTAGIVADKLREWGCDEVKTGIGQTGVVGVIKGKQNTSGKVIGLRADMDALPIFEATGLDYASKEDGKMHACGHDGHTTMLLGAAQYLCETRNFDGTAVVIFQPAEEGGGGGREMVEDGMMEEFGIQEVYGMHNWPGKDVGTFGIRAGAFFAAADLIQIDVTGKGAHAAKPQDGIDTTVVAAHIVIALQTIASRVADPLESVVVSVTSFETESKAFNVIPEKVELRGTVRTLSPDMRDIAEEQITRIAENTAAAFGATAKVTYNRNYPVMVNHDAQTEFMADVAKSVVGDHNVEVGMEQTMGGEDFAFMLESRPGAYILCGNGDGAMVHHPEYNFNDEAIPTGCTLWANIIEQGMPAA